MFRFIFISLLIILPWKAACQLVTPGKSPYGKSLTEWTDVNPDTSDLNFYSRKVPSKGESFRFAVPVNVSLNPLNSGEIVNSGNGKVWRIGIRSKNARSLNLILEPFHIPEGCFFFLCSGDMSVVNGAYGHENNNPENVLATSPVAGEELILEYHFNNDSELPGSIGIRTVNHDFRGIMGNGTKDGRFNMSQACNVDINCPDAINYQVAKNSVCRILINGTDLCSGVLLNNTNNENRAFLLTAEHCIATQADASASLFVFGYESPWCDGPDGRVLHTVSGSSLKAINPQIDFALVELNTFPPITYKPFLSGWDVAGIAPSSTVTVHHPEGDVKKISVDNNPPVTATYTGLLTDGYWKILQWESGTTEGGSSGAPLFDQNRRVVGILTGGEAVCGRSVNDYFAKMSRMYDYSSLLWEQLKGWIDPARSGVKRFDGRDPYSKNYLTLDTLTNISAGTQLQSIPETLPATGYITGFNSDSTVMYAEHFSNTSARHIIEVLLSVSHENHVSLLDSARVYILSSGPQPGTVIASARFKLSETRDNFILKTDFVNAVIVTSDFYVAWRLYYKEKAASETRQFAVFHTPDYSDPLKNTAWFLEDGAWRRFTQHPRNPLSISLAASVVTVQNSVVDNIEPDGRHIDPPGLIIYPNPAAGPVTVKSERLTGTVNFILYRLSGEKIYERQVALNQDGIADLDLSSVDEGYYLASVSDRNVKVTAPLIILR